MVFTLIVVIDMVFCELFYEQSPFSRHKRGALGTCYLSPMPRNR